MTPPDFVLPFSIEGRDVRGRMARLDRTLDSILEGRSYPPAVAMLMAEMVTLTAVLGTMLKDAGIMTLQINGDGPVSLLFADYATPGHLRGYARFDEAAMTAIDTQDFDRLVPRLLHAGTLAVTLDPEGSRERYQGVVHLEGASLSECLQTYFRQSEQLPTAIRLAAEQRRDSAGATRWQSGAIMLQALPSAAPDAAGEATAETAADNWHHAIVMMNSVRDDELLDARLPADEVLYRLFHEDGVRVFERTDLAFSCRCSREKVAGILAQFPADDLAEMTIGGMIEAGCEICGTQYRFDPADFTS